MFDDYIETGIYNDLGREAYFNYMADKYKGYVWESLFIALAIMCTVIYCLICCDWTGAVILFSIAIIFVAAAKANYDEYKVCLDCSQENRKDE